MISLATEFVIGSLRSLMPRSVRADSRPTASWAISFGSNKTSPHPSSEWITSDIGYPSMTRVRDGAIPTEMIVIDYDKAFAKMSQHPAFRNQYGPQGVAPDPINAPRPALAQRVE